MEESNLPFGQDPAYLGPAHKPFALRGPGLANLTLARGMTLARLEDRKTLLRSFDTMRQGLDGQRELAGLDPFTARALEMVSSSKVREAFDLNREPEKVRAKYGKLPGTLQFLLARRLVEAGVRVVTLCGGWANDGRGDSASNLSNWDTHDDNFKRLRVQAPQLDRALFALLDDLSQRGLDKDVVVVACGEMGRSPRVGKSNDGGNASSSGRDHWETGFAWIAGGGLRMGQVVGETDRHGARAKGSPFTPQNLLSTLYYLLGIDPVTIFPRSHGQAPGSCWRTAPSRDQRTSVIRGRFSSARPLRRGRREAARKRDSIAFKTRKIAWHVLRRSSPVFHAHEFALPASRARCRSNEGAATARLGQPTGQGREAGRQQLSRTRPSVVRWKATNGASRYESHTDCSGLLLNALLHQAYKVTEGGFWRSGWAAPSPPGKALSRCHQAGKTVQEDHESLGSRAPVTSSPFATRKTIRTISTATPGTYCSW